MSRINWSNVAAWVGIPTAFWALVVLLLTR